MVKIETIKASIVIFCFAVCGDAFSQDVASPEGVQRESSTPEPVEVAPAPAALRTLKINLMQKGTGQVLRKVEVKTGGSVFYTNPEGNVEIQYGDDTKELVFIRNGFETAVLPTDDLKDTLELDVYLFPKLGADDEVIVKGKRRPGVSKKVISVDEAARVAPGGDPGQVTKLLPGVTTSPGRSEITIRGSEPSDSIFRIDDIDVSFLYHTIGQLTIIPANEIEDVEFSSGGFGPEYGDATGGVVVIRTKKEIPERRKFRFTLNIPLYSGAYLEQPLSETTSMSVGVRRSYLEYILPKFLPKDSGATIIPYFRDYQASWLHKTDGGFQKLSLLSSVDGLQAKFPSEFSSDQEGSAKFFVKNYFGVVAFEQMSKINADWSVTGTPQVGYTISQFEINDLKFRVSAYNLRLPVEFSKRISTTEKLYVGSDIAYTPFSVAYFLPRFDPDDPFYDVEEAPKEEGDLKGKEYTFASWISRDLQLGRWLMTPGVRGFYVSQNDKAGIDPRLSGRFAMDNVNTPKFAVGQYSQYPRNGEAAKGFGNPKLDFPKAYHYILGLESKWNDRWETDFQVFYKDVKDVIRNDSETKYNNEGSIQSRGFEVFLRRAMTERWFGWLAYTWSKTEERKSKDAPWNPGKNDQTHVVNIAGNYRWSATSETGGRYASHTGDTYTSKVGPTVYNANLDKYQPRGDQNAVNNARLPHYNELAFYNSHDFLFDTSKLTFRWGVEFLWFKRQVLSQASNYDYSAETKSQGVPPIPYIELRGEL